MISLTRLFPSGISGNDTYIVIAISIIALGSLSSTLKRELASLKAIDDNYPKYIICKGRCPYDDVDGTGIVDYDEWVKDPY